MNAPVSIPDARVLRNPPEGAQQLRCIPDHVPMPELRGNNDSPFAAVYYYRNADGSLAALIARIETTEGKRIQPLTVWSVPDGRLDWCGKSLLGQRPLYRLPQMLADQDKIVLLSEGEKCADALAGFARYASVTWMGGCKAISRTDFSPLAGRAVIILPDHDAPGQVAANQLTEILSEIGAASTRILDIARLAEACGMEPVPGFDIADAIAGGLDADRFEQLLAIPDMLVDAAPQSEKPALTTENLPTDPVQREVLAQFGIRPEDIPAVFSLTEHGVIKHGADRNGRPTDIYAGRRWWLLVRPVLSGRAGDFWWRCAPRPATGSPDRSKQACWLAMAERCVSTWPVLASPFLRSEPAGRRWRNISAMHSKRRLSIWQRAPVGLEIASHCQRVFSGLSTRKMTSDWTWATGPTFSRRRVVCRVGRN